jgi:hypothetical protein
VESAFACPGLTEGEFRGRGAFLRVRDTEHDLVEASLPVRPGSAYDDDRAARAGGDLEAHRAEEQGCEGAPSTVADDYRERFVALPEQRGHRVLGQEGAGQFEFRLAE